MKNHLISLTLSSLVLATTAGAQPREGITSETSPASDSFEISLGGLYAQGGGTLGSPDLGDGGGGAELVVGRRMLDRHLTIGAYATLGALVDRGPDDDIAIASLGAKADWHFMPLASVDPWISLGAGAKIQWTGERNVYSGTRVGYELARVQAGLDYRVTPSFSIGPTIGASATLYTHENTSMTHGYDEIDDKNVELTFTAGLLGRFDFGARR